MKSIAEKNETKYYEEADFELAISEARFGRFNAFLLLLALPSVLAINFDSTIISYVLPAMHCDLDVSLEQRGLLSGISYLGMFFSAFMWGFLADTLGRKNILVLCYALNACFVILAGFSQTFEMLVTLKFVTGFIINGPSIALTSVLSEFHSAQRRSQIVLCIGLIYGLANVTAPLLAWLIIPMDWNIRSLNGSFILHPWNIFVMISALPSLIAGIGHVFIPESPKYLMTAGKNEQALKVFQKVYSVNTRKAPGEYPVTSLIDESMKRAEYSSSIEALKLGFKQIKPLFIQPYLISFFLLCIMETGFIASLNSLRLWLPQIYTILSDYKIDFPEDANATLCEMLESVSVAKTDNLTTGPIECVKSSTDSSIYTNVLVVSSVTIFAFLITQATINRIGKKPILIVLGCISGVAGCSIYFAGNTVTMTALAAVNNALLTVCADVEMTIIVDLFPTSLRTVAMSIVFMVARLGSLTGNILLPVLLQTGCLPPFLTIGCTALICSLLTFFLPNTDNKALE